MQCRLLAVGVWGLPDSGRLGVPRVSQVERISGGREDHHVKVYVAVGRLPSDL